MIVSCKEIRKCINNFTASIEILIDIAFVDFTYRFRGIIIGNGYKLVSLVKNKNKAAAILYRIANIVNTNKRASIYNALRKRFRYF